MPQPLIIDSGAAETVMPVSWFEGHKVSETEASRNKEYYTTANSAKIYNQGERNLIISSFEGDKQRAMTFQVAEVSKALGSVSQIVKKGNRVVFDDDGSYIQDKTTGDVSWMRQAGGMYYIDLWVSKKSSAEAGF